MTPATGNYEKALFNQILSQELRKPGDIKASIGRALIRFSPGATPKQQEECISSLYETIILDNGSLSPNWQAEIIEQHWEN